MRQGRDLTMKKCKTFSKLLRMIALVLALALVPVFALAEETDGEDNWVTFFLMCNEGMTNAGNNVGSTMMLVAMNPDTGKINLMMFTWDTFVKYEGYDLPQLISTPYRNNGPEGTMEVFNANFGFDIKNYISLNYLNLASLIDAYGGVTVDVSRAERNALNGMVSSKKWALEKMAGSGLLNQMTVELLASEYYLENYGPETHLNGLQAVGYGWLQYDSVYNCCLRELAINADLFNSVASSIADKVQFYTDDAEAPEASGNRRMIDLDQMTDDDIAFLRELVDPIFQMSYNDLSEEDIIDITTTFARLGYQASRQGVNIFQSLDHRIFPLEAKNEYDIVGGTQGHLVDYEANSKAMKAFLYSNSHDD